MARKKNKDGYVLKSEVQLIIQNYIRVIQMNDYGSDNGIPQLYRVIEKIEKMPIQKEYDEAILSDDEKDIIKPMIEFIRKFGCEVNYFCKHKCANGDCFIQTTFKNIVTGSIELMDSPYFNNDMFKGMKIYKKYKLEELGITCPTQKDN